MALKTLAATLGAGAIAGGLVAHYAFAPQAAAPQAPPTATAAKQAPAEPPPHAPLSTVARDLRKGGYILYFRHGNREKWDSVIAFDVYELATRADAANESYRDAVCLTPQGKEEAKMIGKILQLAKVPVKKVIASPSCRAQQTARLAFGRIDETSAGLAHTPVTNPGNERAFGQEIRRVLLAAPAGRGEVTVVAAHGNTLENHPGLFAEGAEMLQPLVHETGFYVIAREGGKLRIVQRFQNLGVFAAHAIDLVPAAAH